MQLKVFYAARNGQQLRTITKLNLNIAGSSELGTFLISLTSHECLAKKQIIGG